jgi:hypothetical protein
MAYQLPNQTVMPLPVGFFEEIGTALQFMNPLTWFGAKYTNVGGICKPKDAAALNWFNNLQDQTNRILGYFNVPLIGRDGEIGPNTLDGVRRASVLISPAGFGRDLSTCSVVADQADAIARIFGSFADSVNAPYQVVLPSGGPTGPATPAPPPPAPEAPSFMSTLMSPVALAAIGMGAILLFTSGGKRRSRR